jgi:hypothetical protein
MARKKRSAHKRGRVKGSCTPLDETQRNDIVEGIVDNLKPWKNNRSRNAITADVNHSIDMLRELVPVQEELLDQKPFREYRKKLDQALSDVEKILESGAQSFTWFLFPPTQTAFVPVMMMSEESFKEYFDNDNEGANAFRTELKRLRTVCAHDIGLHPNYDIAKRRSADFARGLMTILSDQKITTTENGAFRIITGLLYEAVSGVKDVELKRACDDAIRGSYPYLINKIGTDESR